MDPAYALDFSFEADNPRWSISKLNGTRSFADGANCYNAVLTAKGYSDYLMYSDPIEMQYFLTNFCSKNTGEWLEGDVLVAQRYFFKHVGINLRAGFIFEKRNNEGQNKRRSGFSDTGAYSIKEFSDSSQFGYCEDSSCSIDAYTCEDSQTVRLKIYHCEMMSKDAGATEAQELLQQITMNPQRTLESSNELFDQVNLVIEKIKSIAGDQECHIYLLVKVSSIIGNLQLLNFDEIKSWMDITNHLKTESNNLRKRLVNHFGANEKYKKLFEESLWLSRLVR